MRPRLQTLGEALRERREVMGYTQTALARRLGIDQSTISDYELRGRLPNVQIAIGIKRALGMTWGEFEGVFTLETDGDFHRQA